MDYNYDPIPLPRRAHLSPGESQARADAFYESLQKTTYGKAFHR